MNFGQMKSSVFTRLEEAESSPIRWSEADIKRAINEGLEELSDGTEFFERYATLKLTPGQIYYDLRSVIPDPILRVTSLYANDTVYWLHATDVRDLDEKTARQWELVDGEPQRYFLRSPWWLGLFPKSTSPASTVRVYYRALHPELVDDLDVPQQLPEDYHEALIAYALYTLLSDDMETTAALRYWQKYQTMEVELASQCFPGGRAAHARIAGMGSRL